MKSKSQSKSLSHSSQKYFLNYPKILKESQKIPDNQNNPEQNERWLKHRHSRPQDALQSHCNKNTMVLAQKQTCRLLDQRRCCKHEYR